MLNNDTALIKEKNLIDANDIDALIKEIELMNPQNFTTIFDVNEHGIYACGKSGGGCGKCCDYSQ
ncbi:MAG: hypothetical protein Q8K60_00745 [Parachlamydiaceae bacterium]|nr:hypothetical protein [Parachlamydiaceae bacterium]